MVRLHHGGMKRARSQSMPTSEALPQAYSGYTGERAQVGRVLLVIIQSKAYAASWLNTTLETCGSISEVASFSSSLDCICCRLRFRLVFLLWFKITNIKHHHLIINIDI